MSHIEKPVEKCQDNEYQEVAWGLTSPESKFSPLIINRPKVGDNDVRFEMKYCGICHSDVHIARNELGGCMYPVVPGHELVGTVVEVGSKVTKVKVGDNVGVGCIVDSCLDCNMCSIGDEQYCMKGNNCHTYNDTKRYGHIGGNQNQQTFGGYSASNTVHEHFILKIPSNIPLEKAGPILCAGITLYDPLRHWGATKGVKMTIGIIGIGGLGTMGIKLAKALGHKVYAISTSENKRNLAKEKGADFFVNSKDNKEINQHLQTCDLLLNTVSSNHDLNVYLPLLAKNGTIVQLGLTTTPHPIMQLPLIFNRQSVSGSLIGGINATQECLQLCADHQIFPDVQLVEAKDIDMVYETLTNINKDGVRFVIDIKKSLDNKDFIPKF